MSLAFSVAIYFICWWIVLFAVLPFGVRTQDEVGNVVPGTPESAPAAPSLLLKIVITTLIASAIFAIIYVVITYQLLSLDDIPFPLRFEPVTNRRG